jgi:hypothetical protein
MQGLADAFSDSSTEITSISAGDDFAVVEFVGRGTHAAHKWPGGGDTHPRESGSR